MSGPAEPVTGGAALCQALADHGVDTVFGIPGTHNLGIYGWLGHYGIRHVLARHEQGAGYAADGYARASGYVGVALTTTGPAVLNAAAALAQSYSDSVPVLLISPGMPLAHPARGNGLLHEVKDQSAALAAVSTGSYRVPSVAEIPRAVAQAFAEMTAGRPRPQHLEIPLDLLDETAPARRIAPVPTAPTAPTEEAVRQAAEELDAAERPGIVLGGGAKGAAAAVRTLAERLAAPVLTSTNGKGIIPEDHGLSLGAGLHHGPAREFVAECDAVLVVGCELAEADLFHGPLDFSGAMVRVEIDPVQAVTNAAPSHVLVSDARLGVQALLAHLHAESREENGRAESWRSRLTTAARAEGGNYLPILEPIAEALGRDGMLVGDSARVCYYGALSNLARYTPGSFLYPTGLGTLGYALPAALGATLGNPHLPVVALLGDGGLQFTVAELASAAACGRALPVVVVDNQGYGEIRSEMAERADPVHGVDLALPDPPGLARSLGCHGVRVQTSDQLRGELGRALRADRPTLIQVPEGI